MFGDVLRILDMIYAMFFIESKTPFTNEEYVLNPRPSPNIEYTSED